MDFFLKPPLLTKAWDYYKNIQTKDQKYVPLISEKDSPAITLNKKIMDDFKPRLKPYYYDPARYKTYLEQLGIQYPTLRPDQKEIVQKGINK